MTSSSEASIVDPTGFDVYIDHVARRVEVVGDLDLATVPYLIDAAVSLRTDPPRDITIDLDLVTFIDAGAFGALIGLATFQRDHGVDLHISANDHVKRIAGLCGLDEMLVSNRYA